MLDLKALLSKMLTQFIFETSTTTISSTTGTLNSHVMCRMGRLRFLRISVSKSTATAAGSNLFVGKITNANDVPAHYCNGVGYLGSACCPAQLAGGGSDAGTITVRVTGAQVAANASPWISFVYVAVGGGNKLPNFITKFFKKEVVKC